MNEHPNEHEHTGTDGGTLKPLPDHGESASIEKVLGEKLSERLRKELAGIATINIVQSPEGEGQRLEMFRIDVADRSRWRSPECQRTFLPFIGTLLQQTFHPEEADTPLSPDELVKEYDGADQHYMDSMVVVSESQQVRGFTMFKHCRSTKTDNVPVVAAQLTSVEAGSKFKGMGEKLYTLLCSEHPHAAIVGATHTPAAIQARLKSMKNLDTYRLYYCGLRDGDEAKALSEEERRLVGEAEERYREMLNEHYDGFRETIDQSNLPPHCITYGSDSIAWTDEHRWREGDSSPIAQTFGKLRQWVFDHGRQGEGIFGMITLLPKSALQKDFEAPTPRRRMVRRKGLSANSL